MGIDKKSLIKLLSVLMKDVEGRKTIRHSTEGALACGGLCLVGGLLAGPPGMAIGGSIGGAVAYAWKSDTFLSIPEVLENLSDSQYKELVKEVNNAVKDFGVEDLALLNLDENIELRESLIKAVISFIKNGLKMDTR